MERARLDADANADAAADALTAHYRVVNSMLDVYHSSRARYEQEFPQSFRDFQAHAEHAAVASQEDVRFYSTLLWFQRGVPQYLTLALRNLVRAYYEESRLREALGNAARDDDDNRRHVVSQADQEAAAAVGVERVGGSYQPYGMETDHDVHLYTMGAVAFPHLEGLEEEEKFLRACFEVRKVRLEHEDGREFRHPHCIPYHTSLDFSVREFCHRAYATYIDENGQPRQPLSSSFSVLVEEIKSYAYSLG